MLLAASGPKALWYLTRGTGVVALLLLTTAVVLGALCSARWRGERWPRFLLAGLHKNVTLVAVAFVFVHVVSTLADGYAPVGVKDAVIPFVSSYRPIWLGLGALAFDLLLALVITSLVRARIGVRAWRAVHWLAYASWPIALVHGLGTGSDGRFGWLALVAFGSAAIVAISVVVRVSQATAAPGLRIAAIAGAIVVPLLIFVWYRSGPLQHGWAARAGTPTSLLRAATTRASSVTTSAASTRSPASAFDGRLVGQLTESAPNANGLVAVDISGRITGGVEASLRLTLYGARTEEGGVAMTSSSVVFAPSSGPPYAGTVVQLEGPRVVASLTNNSGTRTDLALQLHIDRATGRVRGSVRGSPA